LSGYVGIVKSHVPLIAALLIAVGCLNAICGVLLIGGVIIGAHYAWTSTDDFGRGALIGVVAWGAWLLAAATFQISAGVRNRRFRGRGHGIFALVTTVLCIGPAWIPSLVLAALGIRVYVGDASKRAFEMAR
jgi:hypothetical protein